MIAFLAAVALADDAPCAKATTIAELRAQITTAFGAFADNDADGFDKASVSEATIERCLGEFLLPADAAEVHRFHGLASFYHQEPDYAIQSFQAALILQPGYNLPASVAPQPGPLWTLYDRARGRAAPDSVPLGLGGLTVLVDGQAATTRPSLLPYIAQLQGADGSVVTTQYVPAGSAPTVPEGVVVPPTPGPSVPPPTIAPPAGRKVRAGVEIGFPFSLRIEWRASGKPIDGYGLRYVVIPVVGKYATTGLEGYLDWRLAEKWQFETGIGAGGTATGGLGWLDGAVQYDPKGPFQMNVGLAFAAGAGSPVWPEFSFAWLW